MRLKWIVGAVALVMTSTAIAQSLYRCTGADGKVAYQDRPCASGAQQEQKPINAAPAPSGPAVSAAARARIERDKAKVAESERRERQAGAEKIRELEARVRELQQDPINQQECAALMADVERRKRRDPLTWESHPEAMTLLVRKQAFCGH